VGLFDGNHLKRKIILFPLVLFGFFSPKIWSAPLDETGKKMAYLKYELQTPIAKTVEEKVKLYEEIYDFLNQLNYDPYQDNGRNYEEVFLPLRSLYSSLARTARHNKDIAVRRSIQNFFRSPDHLRKMFSFFRISDIVNNKSNVKTTTIFRDLFKNVDKNFNFKKIIKGWATNEKNQPASLAYFLVQNSIDREFNTLGNLALSALKLFEEQVNLLSPRSNVVEEMGHVVKLLEKKNI
jgi:hypothetical protein